MGENRFDLAIAWEWQYDDGFVDLLRQAAGNAGASLLEVGRGNVDEVFARLRTDLRVGLLLDRASDVESGFLPLQDLVLAGGGRCLNGSRQADWASDKATMHMEFLSAGLEVPYTVLLGPFFDEPGMSADRLIPLGTPFIVKPASFGGGVGVRTARTVAAVQWARAQFPREKFLLQELVPPAVIDGRRAWFRPIYCCGSIELLWWDDLTHIYARCTVEDENRLGLSRIRDTMRIIAAVTHLDFFTAELCIGPNDRLLVVDYVNVPCDLRLRSRHADGVPDETVRRVAERLAGMAVEHRAGPVV